MTASEWLASERSPETQHIIDTIGTILGYTFLGVILLVALAIFVGLVILACDSASVEPGRTQEFDEWSVKTLQKIKDEKTDRETRRQARIFAEEFRKIK
jgi:F0F1-type ATP synthase membrane subunit a